MDRHPLFLLSTVESDSHMWNLVYLELLLKDHGVSTVNLGSCVPTATTLEALRCSRPDALVISSVNGHGFLQAKALRSTAVRLLGRNLPPFLIGGKLSVCESDNASIAAGLKEAGFSEVFVGDGAIGRFCGWLDRFKQTLDLSSEAAPKTLVVARTRTNEPARLS